MDAAYARSDAGRGAGETCQVSDVRGGGEGGLEVRFDGVEGFTEDGGDGV